jgi:hypothetical protein
MKAHPGQYEIATIIPPMLLPSRFDPISVRVALFLELERADFEGAFFRGGIDVIWESALGSWVPLAHVLAVNVPPNAWTRVRWPIRKAEAIDLGFRPGRLLEVQPLRDPEKQIADLVKFHTYFWPRSLTGAPRADSLPPDRLAALADWARQYTFKDFILQFGEATARKSSPSPS